VTGANSRWLAAGSATIDGDLSLTTAGLEVRGTLAGAGTLRFGQLGAGIETLRAGLIFAGGGPARTTAINLVPQDPPTSPIILGVGANTAVTFAGSWAGGGAQQENYAVVRDGGTLTLGAGAAMNLVT